MNLNKTKGITAFILLNLKNGNGKKAVEYLSELKGVKEASLLYGDFDVLARIETVNTNSLNKILLENVRKTPGLDMMSTHIAI